MASNKEQGTSTKKVKSEKEEVKRAKGSEPKAKSKKEEILSAKDSQLLATKKANAEEVKDGDTKESNTAADQADSKRKEEVKTAKAGKRSAKSLKETEEKQAKEERKAHKVETETEGEKKPKIQQKPARSKLERRGKKFREAAKLIEKDKVYSLSEALGLAVKTSPTKFDATIEVHIRLGVDPKQADQNVRDTVVLPAGTGKTVRVAVFADGDNVAAAKKAGADIAAADEFLQQLDKGTIDFDTLIATPAQMPKLGKYARLLGPKGLMPNPKSGTVTTDVAKAVSDAKAGRVEYRVDSTGIVHLGIGKVSFGDKKLADNANAVLASINNNKPSSIKGTYLRSIYLTTTMGPSIAVTTTES